MTFDLGNTGHGAGADDRGLFERSNGRFITFSTRGELFYVEKIQVLVCVTFLIFYMYI